MSRRALVLAVLTPALLGAAACQADAPRFTAPRVLGGVAVPADVLNSGHGLYDRYCATCHGADGRAATPAGRQLDPPPRDLTLAVFKYRAAAGDALPSDADLARTIRDGVAGTGMPPWPGLSDREMHAVIQYIKTLSSRWGSPDRDRTSGLQSVLPAAGTAASVRAGLPWGGDATNPPPERSAQRAAGASPAAAPHLGER